ncbi:MAG: hypothetical protein LAO20_11630 [Acidobacteriia bacterium]|nr:hypothetical protein [Terriglobia bacterium]
MPEKLYNTQGQPISLSLEIGSGGEGVIFANPGNDRDCVKFYPRAVSDDTHRKLGIMVEHPPIDPAPQTSSHRSIAWPSALLYRDSARQNLGGFLMPRIDMKRFHKALVYVDWQERSKRFGGVFTWKHLFTAASNTASAIAAINDLGYCVGDINESNLLIALEALVTVIDCDSFQVPDPKSAKVYRCGVGKGEYSAPELLGRDYKDVDRTIASDSFALGVLLFQLLMEGTHPYQAKGKLVEGADNTEAKIKRGHFAYAMRTRDIAPPDHAPPYELLHPEIRSLFEQCFVAGHRDPAARPNARDWHQLFIKLKGRFVVCPNNQNHCYLDHLRACPWCALKKSTGHDHFLSPVGHQIALDTHSGQADSLDKRIEHLTPFIQVAFADGILTPEEELFLLARGAELQIPPKEIKKAIEAEQRRLGGAKAVSAGTPKLEVSRVNFTFEKIRRGSPASGSYFISNVGGGSLQGKILPRQAWLKASQSVIDPTRHRQEHTFHADTSKLPLGSSNLGCIDIESNGGRAQVQVSVSIEIEKEALSRFRAGVFTLGAILGGLFGYVLYYYLLVDVPSRVVVSAIAGLVGLVGATIAASRSGGFFGGCGTFVIGSTVIGVLQARAPLVFSIIAWGLIVSALLDLFARPLFVGRHAGKVGAAVAALLTSVVLAAAVIFTGISLKDRVNIPPQTMPPVQLGTIATCSKATGWKRFTPKSEFRPNDPICVYAEALNVARNGKIDLNFTVNLKNSAGGVLTSTGRRVSAHKNDPSAWSSWPALKLPANSSAGSYLAEVLVHNNLSNQNGVSSAAFTVIAPAATSTLAESQTGAMSLSSSWSGIWYPTVKSCAQPPYPPQQIRLDLQQSGSQVTGTLSGPGITTGRLAGTVDGTHFAVIIDYGHRPPDGSLQGTLTGNQIRGTIAEEPRSNQCTWSGNFEVNR